MILVYTESSNGVFKKNVSEILSFAYVLAKKTSKKIIALTINADHISYLEKFGVDKILCVKNEKLNSFCPKAYTEIILQVAKNESVTDIIFGTSSLSKLIAPSLSVKFNAVYLPNVLSQGEVFKKNILSSKAKAEISSDFERRILMLSPNSFKEEENQKTAEIQEFNPVLSEELFSLKHLETAKNSGKISLSEASIVVSGGRGMQSPENWHLLENLADALGAGLGCTKPVSDMNWRPHSEHIGQTGKPIACDLYIAVGISGAIQHLAGVNASKKKLVINTDPEAPFFKAADYGIVGDALEILPKLTQKILEKKQ